MTLVSKHFKGTSTVYGDLMLKSVNGKRMKAIDVFSASINCLKKHFLDNINNRDTRSIITVDQVRWALTVPAIWHYSSKQFMRKAAEKVTFLFCPYFFTNANINIIIEGLF